MLNWYVPTYIGSNSTIVMILGQIFCSRGRPLENSRGRPVEFTGRPVKSTGCPLEFSRGRPLEQKIWPIMLVTYLSRVECTFGKSKLNFSAHQSSSLFLHSELVST